MLIIFYGVSCVGKTTLIEELRERFNWVSVPTYMTRPLRNGESDKIYVNQNHFSKLEASNYFVFVNKIFGNSYGTPEQKMKIAIEDANNYWALDFSIKNKHLLDNWSHVGILLLPEDDAQLKTQIKSSNRTERLEAILTEYQTHYKNYKISDSKKILIPVINTSGKVYETAKSIQSIVIQYRENEHSK